MPWPVVIVTIFILFGLICYKYQDPHQNFQTAVHRIRPRAYMVLAEAWAARFWPIALILCNIQCIVPRWLQFAFYLHSLQAFCSEDISSIETANQGQCIFLVHSRFAPERSFLVAAGTFLPDGLETSLYFTITMPCASVACMLWQSEDLPLVRARVNFSVGAGHDSLMVQPDKVLHQCDRRAKYDLQKVSPARSSNQGR